MADLSRMPVLVINASFEPISIISAKRAVILIVKGAAIVQESRGREIRPDFPMPSVIRLTRYRNIPHRVQILSRRNVYLRDRHTCQYCYQKKQPYDLTLDHVHPQSRGGRSTWENLVAACKQCNRRKADKTPEESGMELLNKPRPVTVHTARHLLRGLGEQDKVWRRYLYFENEGSQDHVTTA